MSETVNRKSAEEKLLSVGLIIDSNFVSKYVYELAEWGQEQNNLNISHLIIQNNKFAKSRFKHIIYFLKENNLNYVIRRIAFKLITILENRILLKTRYKDHLKKYSLADVGRLVRNSIDVKPVVSPSGYVYRYDDSDIKRIRDLDLDVLIRCGSGILRGEILNAARHGILSFHHADNRINRGGPPCFWEVYCRQAHTGFIIQQLTEELDGGNVLFHGRIPTGFFFLMNQAKVYAKSNAFLKQLLIRMAESGGLPEEHDSYPYCNRLYRLPTLIQQFRYVAKTVTFALLKLLNRFILNRDYRWNVAYSRANWRNLVMWRGARIQNPPGRFLADPFVFTHKGEDYCFVEDYSYSKKKGCISVYKLNDKRAEPLGEAIVEPFHMAFPYIFEYDSQIYMCPETSENRDIRLYKAVKFPLEWKLSNILMSNVSAADSMLFEHEGIWWLFTNIDSSDINDHASELHIFYADSPFSDNWTPHPMNPVFVDSAVARNGGFLQSGSSKFRISQLHGFDTYGTGFSINRITTLNKLSYSESRETSISPGFLKGIKGTHHLHSNGKVTAFDYVEMARTSN